MQTKYGGFTPVLAGTNYTALYECRYVITDMSAAEAKYYQNGPNSTILTIPDNEMITGNVEVKRNPGMARHYAFLFNMYVMLQIFNEINAKKLLPQEINVFSGLFNNMFFLIIFMISIVVQTGFVQI